MGCPSSQTRTARRRASTFCAHSAWLRPSPLTSSSSARIRLSRRRRTLRPTWEQAAEFGLKDVDLIYFDEQDLSFESEASHERCLRDLFQHLPIKLDVKNEARVHLWYEDRFGDAIKPYSSSADAIATFPTTATAVGVRQIRSKFECCAPFGLDDLFSLVVRPNKRQITRAIYEAKVDRWRSIWPRLTFLPWEEMIPPGQ